MAYTRVSGDLPFKKGKFTALISDKVSLIAINETAHIVGPKEWGVLELIELRGMLNSLLNGEPNDNDS